MSVTESAEHRIMGLVLGRLLELADQIQRKLVTAHVNELPVPALDRNVARLIGAMRRASSVAVARTPGLATKDVKPALNWRTAKLKAVVKAVKADEKPPLGLLLGLVQQARGFGSDLERHVSDTLVTNNTEQQDQECGPDEVLIVQPERDACVICLKYAGQYRDKGETFQGGQTFNPSAPKPDPKERIPGPPFHNRCRCDLVRIPRSSAKDNSVALKREAERSILKGWALPSESDAVRTAAAKELLASGVVAPKSVIAETRKRLKSGASFIRDVP